MTCNTDHTDVPSSRIPNLKGKKVVIRKGWFHRRLRLRLVEVIGKGTWGVVYRARDVKKPKLEYAVKCISYREMSSKQFLYTAREVELHERCSSASENVLRFYGGHHDEDNKMFYIVTELCEGGDLLEYILGEGKARVRNNDTVS